MVETGRVLTERCGLSENINLQVGDALDLPFADETFDVVWCQNVTMNIEDKAGFLSSAYRALRPGGIFTSTEFSTGPGGEIIYPVTWAYDASMNFLDTEDQMRAQFEAAGSAHCVDDRRGTASSRQCVIPHCTTSSTVAPSSAGSGS